MNLVDHPVSIRSVSGWGPRCGCGGKSTLHLCGDWPVTPETSTFLCGDCVCAAITAFMLARPTQPSYWPGDEDRDESYAPPADALSVREESA